MFTLDQRLANDTLTIGHFNLSRVLLTKDKRYPWCILVPQVAGIKEAYQLSASQQDLLQQESSLLGRAMMDLFNGDSLNVAALGNVVSQLHVHHVVRYHDDETWPGPIWGVGQALDYTEQELAQRAHEITKKLLGAKGFKPVAS